MPNPNEIVEVAVGDVDGVNVAFNTSRPYFPGSAMLYLNGQLKDAAAVDGLIETNPSTGAVTLKIAPAVTDTVQLAYVDASFRPLFVDEAKPIHIRDLANGSQVRIAMKAGGHIEQDNTGFATSPQHSRRARGYSRTVFMALVAHNNPAAGYMIVNVQGYRGETFVARVEYKNILQLQRVVSRGRQVVETAPKSHPGAKAFGTKMSQLFPQPFLVPVVFVGG